MKHISILLLTVILISGCTSTVAIGTAYNSAARNVTSRLTDYAEFSTSQRREIKSRVSAFHQWHRQQHLPDYHLLLSEIARGADDPGNLSRQHVDRWVRTFRGLLLQTGQCNPLNDSSHILSSLSDRQVQQVAISIRDKQIQRVREYQSETKAQRLKRRQTDLTKWAARAGINFTDEQSMLLNNTLTQQISLTPQRHQLWQNWSDQFVRMLQHRSQPQFSGQVHGHIASLWNLTEQTYPEQWDTNIKLWSDFLYRFLKSQTPEQSRRIKNKLNSVAKSLAKLSNKKTTHEPRCFATAE
jgi:hypothetical protein